MPIEWVETVLMRLCQFNIGSTATWITRIVKLFAFLPWTSAFDSVKHELLANKFKKVPIESIYYQLYWYLNFLMNRAQSVCFNNLIGKQRDNSW